MATKKYTKKDIKSAYKKGKKVAKKAKKHPILTFIVVLLLLAIVGGAGFVFYTGNQAYSNFKTEVEEYLETYEIPSEIYENIPLLAFLEKTANF